MAETPGGTTDRPATRTGRVLVRLDRAAHRRWFLPTVALFPLGDFAVPVMPNQTLVVALSALQPRRRWAVAFTFVAAAGVGALLTASAVQAAGPRLLDRISGGRPDQGVFRDVMRQIERYGMWALAGLSLLPSPPRTAVLVCALAGISPWTIALAVLTGRPVPVTVLTVVGAKAPRLLRRFRPVVRALAEVEASRAPHP